jgi:hypothetical protein
MTAGYTEAELKTLADAMLENQPVDPSGDDIKTAPCVTGMVMAARYNGVLLKVLLQSGRTFLFNLNSVVASELMSVVNQSYNGWPSGLIPMLDAEISISATEETLDIISFAAGADANGLPVNFTDGTRCFMVYLPRAIAMRVHLAITAAGEAAGWWNKDHVLQPAHMPEEIEIQQEAALLMSRYGLKAEMEASQRASRALEQQDKFNHELWIRVTAAIQELERTMPPDHERPI